jgi:dihydroorotase
MEKIIEGNALVENKLCKCSIGIGDGKITHIKKILHGKKYLDYQENLILPAAIDVHVHFRDPGMTRKEDFYTGTRAAAHGGVSCVLDMPNTNPPTITPDFLDKKISIAEKKACIDYGIYAGITKDNIKHIPRLSKKCTAFKIYLPKTPRFPFSSSLLPQAITAVENTKKVLAIHAEDDTCLENHTKESRDLYSYASIRPPKCEEAALIKIIKSLGSHQARIHICHLSSRQALQAIPRASQNISIGVTPHHLLLTYYSQFEVPGYGKVNPPLREKKDCNALFQALKTGVIDLVESDHAPHTRSEKNSFPDAPSGIPGVETTLPLFLWLVKKGDLSLQRMVEVLAKKPSELFHINKGNIKVGYDADLVITDLKEEKITHLHHKCGWSPYQGKKAIFPHTVFVRGIKVIDKKEFVSTKGMGKRIT